MCSHMINVCEHKVSIAYHLEKQDYSPKNNTKKKKEKMINDEVMMTGIYWLGCGCSD